ncbi:flagellar hook-basal body protein [Peribacillus glennii]|uniref:Flagellar hook-basal body protein n=1 Tax=Peribacillus glennii TaxID=2303991 RepID=A0A372L6K4_9BACI|nr:flagellar hook-basal body protein [Peribacillus glennii]RFU60729.1 flagellar hook-basal body protein [Peribacillus glennii]
MLRGFYTAASGMLAQQRRTEMLSNNMANANTPGFKADQSSVRAFPQMLLDRIDSKSIPTEKGLHLPIHSRVGELGTGVYMQEATPKFLQGDVQQTQRNTDIALVDGNMPLNDENGLKGTVFFTVANADGDLRYTRNGNFALDGQGYLTTPQGFYVLDDNNNRIQLNSENFSVGENGIVLENDQQVARLGISFAENPYALIKEGDGLFRNEEGALGNAYDEDGVTFTMQQGFIEGSNVDGARTMTDMMATYRSFEANQKVLQAYDRSLEKAVNEIGRLG